MDHVFTLESYWLQNNGSGLSLCCSCQVTVLGDWPDGLDEINATVPLDEINQLRDQHLREKRVKQ